MKTWTSMLCVCGLAAWLVGCEQATTKVEQAAASAEHAAADVAAKTEAAGEAVGETVTAATEEATKALEGVEGGTDLLKKVQELFASATAALSEVKDEATAGAADTKLAALSLEADTIKPLLDKLPESAKAAIVGVIEKGIASLKVVTAKVLAIPGVEALVKPKIDELMHKLEALVAKPV
jgi:hypothetical protein